MVEVATISFRDLESQSDAIAVLRGNGERIYLCLSVESNGDVEVAMNKAAARELLQALRKALDELSP